MAARENTALQAALIIFVLLTIGLSVSTYMSFRSSEEAYKKEEANKQALAQQLDKYKNLSGEARCLRFILGWETTVTKDEVEGEIKGLPSELAVHQIYTAYQQDMARFGEGLTNANYRSVPENLLTALKQKSEELVKALAKQRELQTEMDNVVAKETKRADEMVKAADESEKKRAAAEVDFNKGRQEFIATTGKLETEKRDVQSQVNTERKRAEDAEKLADSRVAKTNKLNERLREQVDQYEKDENFEVPDGEIASVNQRTNTVMVNLGSADGLRRQIMFSVYDKSENSATRAQKKAGIEITRIIDAHTSEGRIIHSSITNPILPKDYVYSPVWHRGPRLRFAMTGFLDIDGDGLNDRQLVKDMILLNGGLIDEEQDEKGKITGQMTLATRYLLDVPATDFPDKTSEETLRQGRGNMQVRAKELGVEIMYVREILGHMGWKAEDKAVQIGTSSNAAQAKKDKAPGEFQKREPPARSKDGAF